MDYVARIADETREEQPLLEHLRNTAQLAAEFAGAFRASEMGYLTGLLHDIGKYSDAFQRRIRGSPERVDHSTAGALEAFKLRQVAAAFSIAGHHGGLPDGGAKKSALPQDATFFGKMKRAPGRDIADYSAFRSQIEMPDMPPGLSVDRHGAFFFTRMLFSCLVDADFLDTERFMSGGQIERGGHDDIASLLDALQRHTAPWWNPQTPLNQRRCDILSACIDGASGGQGFYTLTVPTGGGKTVASMAFALNHAKRWGLRRVIYVIPYTSIIEQTHDVFSEIFGAENVLAHYADVEHMADEDGAYTDRHRLAAENWDAPIILTTSVQFFESLYANRSSRCRKLHNMANSVLIFDEAQMLPVPYLKPCVAAISQLVDQYGCTGVLCTATQPSLGPLFREFSKGPAMIELCPPSLAKDEVFRRVSFVHEGELEDSQLAQKLSAHPQVLCIVNSRKQAQTVHALLPSEGSYHLSTTMYPAHRRRSLADIRERLKDGRPCRVVATSLIEAGVDVDFPVVYRAIAGLDAVIQAGGRCNREGKRPAEDSLVHLFQSEGRAPDIIQQNMAAAEHAMGQFKDLLSPPAVSAYFDFLYYVLKDPTALDAKGILEEINHAIMPFASVASRFRLIEGADHLVYIPLEEGERLVNELIYAGPNRQLMRKLGAYAVGVFPGHFNALVNAGAVQQVTAYTAILRDLTRYSQDTGLSFQVGGGLSWFG